MERYADASGEHRLDQIVSGGGGAPIYTYRSEPDLAAYQAAGAAEKVSVRHLVAPGKDETDNPHHFLVVRVDGDTLSIAVIGTGETEYRPYGAPMIELVDAPALVPR